MGGDDWRFGYVPSEDGSAEFIRSLGAQDLRAAAPWLFDADDESPVLLYRALLKADPKWIVGKQGIGDCVSWGWAHGATLLRAINFTIDPSIEFRHAATEPIYGGSRVEALGKTRGGYSDGSYGAAAAKWVTRFGILFREDYAGLADLTRYSADRAKDWGNYGCGGRDDRGRLDARAKVHPIRGVALVVDFEQAAVAIRHGYPVPVCSGQGFRSVRDRDGFALPSGSWSHCMVFIGARFGARPGLLCLNSWGPNWISGPRWPADQPEGSFWVDARVATRMLAGRDSFAISDLAGWPARKLDHLRGW